MLFNYFAGAIFTTQEVVTFGILAFTVIGILFGLILFYSKKLIYKKHNNIGSSFGIGKALVIGFGLLSVIILLFFVAPTMVKDNSWDRKQQSCAKEVGYNNPNDNNSGSATAETQTAYRNCLRL